MKVLLSGLGGGLDIMNCIPFYLNLKNKGFEVELASIRPFKLNLIDDFEIYEENYIISISGDTTINCKGRFSENLLAKELNKSVFLINRNDENNKYNSVELAKSFQNFIRSQKYEKIIFVDGGGDSLILTNKDASSKSQHSDPFKGGDAFALKMISEIQTNIPIELITTTVGLDIEFNQFEKNLFFLKKAKIFKQKENILDLNILDEYNKIVEKILYLDESNPNRIKSQTATVLYHAINQNFGIQRTYVPWEYSYGMRKGVLVERNFLDYYIFDPKKIHPLKKLIN